MFTKNINYERRERDHYPTPPEATRVILPHLPARVHSIWECAAGDGAMADVFRRHSYEVTATDLCPLRPDVDPLDFFEVAALRAQAIVTNPPYNIGARFVRHALKLAKPRGAVVAMLLPVAFDAAKSRYDLFGHNPHHIRKIIMTERIKWIPGELKASPAQNHCWHVWDFTRYDPCEIHYSNLIRSDDGVALQSR